MRGWPAFALQALVSEATGASRVVAFDHNLRAKQRKEASAFLKFCFIKFGTPFT